MQIQKIITVAAATLVLTGAVVAGTAVASSRHAGGATVNPGKHSITQGTASSSTDTDTVQQGDQTGPETPDPAEDSTSGPSGATGTDPGTESGSESGTGSDGPGGHDDPPGNVDHQFDGEE